MHQQNLCYYKRMERRWNWKEIDNPNQHLRPHPHPGQNEYTTNIWREKIESIDQRQLTDAIKLTQNRIKTYLIRFSAFNFWIQWLSFPLNNKIVYQCTEIRNGTENLRSSSSIDECVYVCFWFLFRLFSIVIFFLLFCPFV